MATGGLRTSDRAELSNLIKEVPLPLTRETLRLDDGGHLVLLDLYPILDDLVLFLIRVAMILGDDNAWHAGAHLEVTLSFLKRGAKKLAQGTPRPPAEPCYSWLTSPQPVSDNDV